MHPKFKQHALFALVACACASASFAQGPTIGGVKLSDAPAYVTGTAIGVDPDDGFGVPKHAGMGLRVGKPILDKLDLQAGVTGMRETRFGRGHTQYTAGLDGLYMFSRDQLRP
ncbi:MAG TPA: hypothetical protein VIN03_09300 [Roseateles sp.]